MRKDLNKRAASFIAVLLTLAIILAGMPASGAASKEPTSDSSGKSYAGSLDWLKPGVYAEYEVRNITDKGYAEPRGIIILYPYTGPGIGINATSTGVEISLSTKGICRHLVYGWRVLEANSTTVKVLLTLEIKDLEIITRYMGSEAPLLKNTTKRYPLIIINRTVYVDLRSNAVFYNGRRIGTWPYWIPGNRLRSSTFLLLTNYTGFAVLPGIRLYVVMNVSGPISLQGQNTTVTIPGTISLGPERLAVARPVKSMPALLRALGYNVSENISPLKIIELTNNTFMMLTTRIVGAIYYDMNTGLMVKTYSNNTAYFYVDDMLYKVLGVGGIAPQPTPPKAMGEWGIVLTNTNIPLGAVVKAREDTGTWKIVIAPILVLIMVLLAAAYKKRIKTS